MNEVVKNCKMVKLARHGELNGRAVLTDHEVDLLRRMHESGCSYRYLAFKFDISLGQAFRVATYRQR